MIILRKKIRTVGLICASFLLSLNALIVNAQGRDGSSNSGSDGSSNPSGGECPGQALCNPLKANSLEDLLQLLLDAVVRIGTIILVLAIIWTGFLFVKARGNAEALKTARTAFMWTIIGGLILLGAEAIGLVIKETANTL